MEEAVQQGLVSRCNDEPNLARAAFDQLWAAYGRFASQKPPSDVDDAQGKLKRDHVG